MPFYLVQYSENKPVSVTETYAFKEKIGTQPDGLLTYAIIKALDMSNATIRARRLAVKKILERNTRIILRDYD